MALSLRDNYTFSASRLGREVGACGVARRASGLVGSRAGTGRRPSRCARTRDGGSSSVYSMCVPTGPAGRPAGGRSGNATRFRARLDVERGTRRLKLRRSRPSGSGTTTYLGMMLGRPPGTGPPSTGSPGLGLADGPATVGAGAGPRGMTSREVTLGEVMFDASRSGAPSAAICG